MPRILRICLLLFFCGLASLAFSQKVIPDEVIIDYSAEDKALRDVLFELGEKADVTIAWQEEILPGDSIISLSIRRERLGKVVDYIIAEHDLRYKIIGNQIVIKRDPYNKTKSPKDKVTISGVLKDAESGETLVSANVYLYDQTQGTTTNEYGFYSFTLDKNLQRIYYSYLGYDLGIKEISLTKDTVIDVSLKPTARLSEIVITDTKLATVRPLDEPDVASVHQLPLDKLAAKLPLGGEPDVLRLALTLPGITSGTDGFGGMSVRGGSTNQNLILFDGIPIYNAQHAFGLFSIFNSNVIKSAKIYKGAFPSHYSGRLSSVMDIRTREGNNQKLSGDFSLGLLTVSGSLEGPIQKDKSSFLISVRRTFVDTWIRSLTRAINDNTGSSSIYFFDVNTKINFQTSRKSKLFFSFYRGNDHFDKKFETLEVDDDTNGFFSDLDELQWDSGNSLATLRWNAGLSQKLFLNTNFYLSNYNFDSFDHDRIDQLDSDMNFIDGPYTAGYYQTKVKDLGARLTFDYIPGPKHFIKFGAGVIRHKFQPGFLSVNQGDSLNVPAFRISKSDVAALLTEDDLNSNEIEFFIEDNIKIGRNATLNLGYNHMIISTGSKSYTIPQPRILFQLAGKKSIFKASWGRMGQFLHTLTNTGLGVPVDVLLPSTDRIAPETSWIASMGQHFITDKLGTIGFEVFYKEYQGLTRYSDQGLISITSTSNWEGIIPIGEGESYGAEFSLNKSTSKTDLSLAYTLSWSNRFFEEIQEAKFPYRYDRRHVINVGLIHKLAENIEVSANWEFGSGTPITIPTGAAFSEFDQNGNQIDVLIYESINNDHLPDYHRLDFGFNLYNTNKWGDTKLTLGIYNVYNRQNPFIRDIVFNEKRGKNLRFEDITILPFLPTFNYSVSF